MILTDIPVNTQINNNVILLLYLILYKQYGGCARILFIQMNHVLFQNLRIYRQTAYIYSL